MSSKFASLINQNVLIVPSFTLECGTTLRDVPVAYKTWGTLNQTRDNVMIICHAFTGSADVEDWCVPGFADSSKLTQAEIIRWGPMMGRRKAFDPSRFFIICANVLGSPYGSASPVTINPNTGKLYGPEFPPTTIRDDVRYVLPLFPSILLFSNTFAPLLESTNYSSIHFLSVALPWLSAAPWAEWQSSNGPFALHQILYDTSFLSPHPPGTAHGVSHGVRLRDKVSTRILLTGKVITVMTNMGKHQRKDWQLLE